MPGGLPAHARDLRGKVRGVRLRAGTTGPASPKSGCGRGPADAVGFGLRMKSRPSKRCFPAKHKLCQCKFFLLFTPKSNSYVIHKGPSLSAEKGSGPMPQIQCTILFFFPSFRPACLLFAGPGKSPAQPPGSCTIRAAPAEVSVPPGMGTAPRSRSTGGLMRNICINKIWKEENLFPTVNYLIDCLLKLH